MGGEEGPLNLPMSALFALVFAIIGIVLLMTIIFSGLKPYEQIARANADRLASAIDEACFTDHEVQISDFYLPQNTPIFSKESAFAPTLRIRSDGDPKYVLYYEMFSPGEAIGWEVYHDFDYRAVAMLPDNLPANFDMHSFISDVRNSIFDKYKNGEDPPNTVDVFIGNLLLSDSIDPITGEAADAKSIIMGKWDGNKFSLSTEFFSSAINKTISKYLACGDNVLCLKTPNAIYAYDLPHCKGKIDYMQLNRKHDNHYDNKYSDFYLASPCKVNQITVKLANCRNNWDCTEPFNCNAACGASVEYPIYDYQGDSLNLLGYHKTCLNAISGGDDGTCTSGGNLALEDETNCIRVGLDERDGFCFTLEQVEGFGSTSFSIGSVVSDLISTNPHPVSALNECTKIADSYVYVLRSVKVSWFEGWNLLKEWLGFTAIWRWPN